MENSPSLDILYPVTLKEFTVQNTKLKKNPTK